VIRQSQVPDRERLEPRQAGERLHVTSCITLAADSRSSSSRRRATADGISYELTNARSPCFSLRRMPARFGPPPVSATDATAVPLLRHRTEDGRGASRHTRKEPGPSLAARTRTPHPGDSGGEGLTARRWFLRASARSSEVAKGARPASGPPGDVQRRSCRWWRGIGAQPPGAGGVVTGRADATVAAWGTTSRTRPVRMPAMASAMPHSAVFELPELAAGRGPDDLAGVVGVCPVLAFMTSCPARQLAPTVRPRRLPRRCHAGEADGDGHGQNAVRAGAAAPARR
jgi:hypothetical protein